MLADNMVYTGVIIFKYSIFKTSDLVQPLIAKRTNDMKKW